jgi:hypothetical protein
MMPAELLRYWPNEADLGACIKTVAEASSEAVALAVHQPMTFEVRAVSAEGTRTLRTCDEGELLKAFLSDNLPEGRLILLISGDTGVGKSHVIRWLDAQLNRLSGEDRRLVIRIRKGMSLKDILRLILDKTPEQGLEKYRRQIESARESIDPVRAAGQLCEDLAQTLYERFEQAQQQLIDNPADRTAREVESFCRTDKLPTLLRSQYLRDAHFIRQPGPDAGPVRRLIEHLTESRAAVDDDDRKREFIDADLQIANRVDLRQLGPAEKAAVIELDRPDRRRIALRILNETIDGATTRLTGTDPAVGELFDAVRRDLLASGKELVLLIEDFAALVGLQRQLLEVVIRDAIREGERELCTMRTALAYTAGYSYMPDTVRTRAGVEYVIPNIPGDEESVFLRVERQVGAYLNASRLGQSRLEQAYKEGGGVPQETAWIPRFEVALEPEDAETLAAFGSSDDGYELFPFNRAAIRALAREAPTHEGRVSYNPRYVNQHVLRDVLEQRDDFIRGAFPPARFGSTKLSATMATEIEPRVPRSELQRYLRMLAYWGGRPDDLEQVAQVPEPVFRAFGLDRAPFADITVRPRQQPKPQTSNPPVDTAPSSEQVRDAVLEQWRSGVEMPQAKARELRRAVAGAIAKSIRWDWYLFRPQANAKLDDWRDHVFIPKAAGNEGRTSDTGIVAVCTDAALNDEVKSAQIAATVTAIQRLHEQGSLDYDGADEDFPRYAAFVMSRAARATQWVLSRPLRAEWDPASSLTHGLLISARALGVPGADNDRDTASLIDALFAPVPLPPAPPTPSTQAATGQTAVLALLEKLAACRGNDISDSDSWRGLLLERIGARQGQGTKVHAVDVVPLKSAIDSFVSSWDFVGDMPPRLAGAPAFDRLKSNLADVRRLMPSLEREAQRLLQWRQQMDQWLGSVFDKDQLVKELRDTAEAIRDHGLAGGINVAAVAKSLEEFRAAPIKAALNAVAALDDPRKRGPVLTVIGKRLDGTIALADQVRDRFDELLRTAAHELQVNTHAIGSDPVGDAVSTLVAEFDRAAKLLEALQQ